MSHIHEHIDWTIVAYVVHERSVLFIFHKELQKWLPLGGHVELDENPDEALLREVKEESGIKDVEVLSSKPKLRLEDPSRKFLYTPAYVDIHPISKTHRHIGLVYFLRAKTNIVKLAEKEHTKIQWLTKDELDDPRFYLESSIKFYAKKAIQQAGK
jgi:8-oxo-dGTP pyrophosphatase MutT (NUDIX family)